MPLPLFRLRRCPLSVYGASDCKSSLPRRAPSPTLGLGFGRGRLPPSTYLCKGGGKPKTDVYCKRQQTRKASKLRALVLSFLVAWKTLQQGAKSERTDLFASGYVSISCKLLTDRWIPFKKCPNEIRSNALDKQPLGLNQPELISGFCDARWIADERRVDVRGNECGDVAIRH